MRKIKRRKTSLVIILLILVFFISIGYASISTTLNVNGTATIKKSSSVVPDSVTVTFDANGGTVNTNTKDVEVGSQYGELPTPTKGGHTFLGWTTLNKDCGLPSEYQEVEYLYSTGAQYINTNLHITNDLKLTLDFKINSTTTQQYMMGIYQSDNGSFYLYNSDGYFQTAYGSAFANTTKQVDTNRHYWEFYIENGNTIAKCDNNVVLTRSALSTLPNLNILIGGTTHSTSVGNYIYGAKFYKNNSLIRNFIPCYRKSDGEIGMYDTVNGVFYTNNGTGTFQKGDNINYITSSTIVENEENHTLYAMWAYNPTVTLDANGGSVMPATIRYDYNSKYTNLPTPTREGYTFLGWKTLITDYELPSEYQEVEYLYSAGAQYINTNLPITADLKLALDFKVNSTTTQQYIMGRYQSNEGSFYLYNSSGYFQTAYGNGYADTTKQVDTNRHYWEFYIENGNTIAKCDNNVVLTRSALSTLPNLNILIGGTTHSTSVGNYIYGAKFYKNNSLIRNFIPCYRKSDNVSGLYDTVNGVFYTNNGIGTFETGNIVINQYITSTDKMITNKDHTLYAVWEEE